MTTPVLTPNETVTGTEAQREEILTRLTRFRRQPEQALKLSETHPALSFRTLDAVVRTLDDRAVFDLGVELARERFAALGLASLLPMDRVFVGVVSTVPAHGGFNYPLHPYPPGYRYVQAAAVITRYGDLHGTTTPAPGLTALDLVRAYAHDCLHYGTFRSYRLGTTGTHRSQHGINFRREDGRTYSARDATGSASTRNLGVIMEGAIDREATAPARATAAAAKVACPPGGIDLYAFRDCTGNGIPAPEDKNPWLASMNGYARSVTTPYAGFLAEIAGPDEHELHDLIIRATLDGDLEPLQRWLEGRYGPGEFTALFRSSAYAPA